MRRNRFNRKVHGWLLPAALSVVALSGRPPVYPDYPVRQVNEYQVKTSQSGLVIAVQPLEDAQEQKTYFKTELSSKGFLPLFVVLHNQSGSDSFLLRKDEIAYGSGELGLTSPTQGSKKGQAVALAGGIALAGASVAGLPAIFVGLKMIAKSTEVQQNILKKELRSLTLSPGGTGHGFLFVPTAKGSAPREKLRLRIPVSRIGSEEILNFDVVF